MFYSFLFIERPIVSSQDVSSDDYNKAGRKRRFSNQIERKKCASKRFRKISKEDDPDFKPPWRIAKVDQAIESIGIAKTRLRRSGNSVP